MTKVEALMKVLEIIKECESHSSDGDSCSQCAFGCGSSCLLSGGNEIPTDWRINTKVDEWMRGDSQK